MSEFLMRRSLPVVALLLAISLSIMPSALGAHPLHVERLHTNHHQKKFHAKHHRHQKADNKSGRKGDKTSVNQSTVFNARLTSATFLFGEGVIQSHHAYLGSGRSEAVRFRALGLGTTGATQIFIDSSNTATTVFVGIYGDANGHPGSLLSTGSISSPTAGAWNPASLTAQAITPGSYYWLAILGEGGTLHFRDHQHGSCLSSTSAQHSLSHLPATWSSGNSRHECPLSGYVTAAEPIVPLPPAAPVNTALPVVSGTTTEGQTLDASTGTWSGSPTSFTYQWQDCDASGASCVDVSGAASVTYVLSPSDVNHTVRVVVGATNSGGSGFATSPATAVVAAIVPPAPLNTVPPSVSGTTTEGQALSASNGTWEGSPTSYGYQWQDCDVLGNNCVDIAGASAQTYTLSASDVGDTVRVVVTARNAGGSSSMSAPATATVVAVPPPAPGNTALPTIGGTTTEGQTLSATTGTWTGSPTSYTYQWQDCNSSGAGCSNKSGATSASFVLGAGDVEHTIRVVVAAANSGGATAATSSATATVTAAVVNTACTTTIGSGLSTAIKNAASGSTICLNAGNYGEVNVTTSKSSMVTVRPASGVSQAQAVVGYTNVTTSSNLTFEGLTITGGNSGSSSAPATHIHWVGDSFTSGLCILTPTSAGIDVRVEGSTFFGIGEGKGGCGNEGRLEVNGVNKGVSGTNGVVISHSTFGRGGCTDGVNITGGGTGTVIGPGDVFENMKEGSCAAHVDPIQFYGGPNTTVTGDYFHGNSDGIMSPDGNGNPMTVTNNVFDTDGEYPNQIVIGGGGRDVISHNTFGHGGSIRIGHGNVGATANNETITNNILTGGLSLTEGQSSSGWIMENNLSEGGTIGTHGISGKPTYVGGGSEPTTWAGWALTSSSLGHLGASDGTDVGATYFGS